MNKPRLEDFLFACHIARIIYNQTSSIIMLALLFISVYYRHPVA